MSYDRVSRETFFAQITLTEMAVVRLRQYVSLLDRWRHITDLISDRAFEDIWSRHIDDSLRLYQVRSRASLWLDFGSGAGFPAVILAIMTADAPGAQVHCVESDGRKCAFLRTVAEQLHIPMKIYNVRAERLAPSQIGAVDVVTARAFSNVRSIVNLAAPFLQKGAELILPRGKSFHSEIDEIDKQRYKLRVDVSASRDGGAIFQISKNVRDR